MTLDPNMEAELRKRNHKGLLYVGLVGIVMAFGGLLSALVVSSEEGKWFSFDIPQQFTWSIGLIVLSSVALYLANRSYASDKTNSGKMALRASLVLGLLFGLSQFLGWKELVASDIHFVGTGRSASFFYFLTGFHLLHVIAGYIVMLITLYKAGKGKYNSSDYLGVQLCGIYWHFLGLLWIVIFMFLAFYS